MDLLVSILYVFPVCHCESSERKLNFLAKFAVIRYFEKLQIFMNTIGLWVKSVLQNSSSDGNVSGEWAFIVDVGSLDRFFWGFESKTDVFVISNSFL